jgi:hypothetical protein
MFQARIVLIHSDPERLKTDHCFNVIISDDSQTDPAATDDIMSKMESIAEV